MKDKLQEIYEGLKERLKSPFLLTFIAVWTIHNWEFVYAFLTFNSDMTYINRVSFLKAYLIVHNYDELLWLPLLWTFVSIGLYFVGSFLSEGLNLIYSKWVRTWLYLVIDKNKLKTEDDYNLLEERRKKLQELVFDLRRKEEDAALKLKNVEESLKKTISEQRDEITKYLTVSTEKERVITEKTTEVEKIKKESEDLKEKMGKINVDNKLLKEQYKELESFRLWTRKNHATLFDTWQHSDANDKFATSPKANVQPKIKDIFEGNWTLTYTKNGKSGSEKVSIDETNKYSANGKHAFDLTNTFLDPKTKTLRLSKINLHGKLHSNEDLKIVNDSLVTGTDSIGYTLEYKRNN